MNFGFIAGPQAEDLGIVDEKDIIDEASLQHMTQLVGPLHPDTAWPVELPPLPVPGSQMMK